MLTFYKQGKKFYFEKDKWNVATRIHKCGTQTMTQLGVSMLFTSLSEVNASILASIRTSLTPR